MARPPRVPYVLYLLSAILVATPATAALRPGDIVVNEGTDNGEMLRVDPETGAVSHLSQGGLLRLHASQMALDALGRILTFSAAGLVAVDPDTGAQTLLAPPIPSISIQAVAVATTGEVYATSPGSSGIPPSIFRIDPTTGAYPTVSSGGSLVFPVGIMVDADGSLVVADGRAFGGTGGILRIDPSTGAQTTVASGGNILRPAGILVEPGGQIVITTGDPNHTYCFEPNCAAILRVDPGDGSQSVIASGGPMRNPYGVAREADGHLLVVDDYFNDRIGRRLIRIDSVTGAQVILSTRFRNMNSVLVVTGFPVAPAPSAATPCQSVDRAVRRFRQGVCRDPAIPDCTCFEDSCPGYRDAGSGLRCLITHRSGDQ
jgi:sugar lactone lactonase YvrE